jgi:hypothetical protein
MSSPSRPGLDEPPPSPNNFPGQSIPEVGGSPDSAKAITQMGFEIDKALTTLAAALPNGKGGDAIAKAKRLIQIALADALSESQESTEVLPGAAGMSFPSGGFGASGP